MDEGYYLRQAEQESKRLEGHQTKVSKADSDTSKAEAAVDKAMDAADKASSPGTAKSKRSEADRHRAAARRGREARAKASKDIATSQAKINGYEKKAREAAASLGKKEREGRKRDEERARRAVEEEKRSSQRNERDRAAQDATRQREVGQLRARTDELEQQLRAARLEAPKQICVLFVAGTIEGGKLALHLDREIREIGLKVRASEYRDQVRFEQLQATQIRDITDGLNRFDPDIVHFSGHGDHRSLLFEGADGRPHELRDEQLALLLQVARKPIRLLVLNACLSADQAALATDYVDAAVGMEESIADDTAKVFAGQFYASLAAGNSLANASIRRAFRRKSSMTTTRGSRDYSCATGSNLTRSCWCRVDCSDRWLTPGGGCHSLL
jgi:hypothetical protein